MTAEPPLRRAAGIALRLIAAIPGGYVLASLAAIAATVWLPLERSEAVLTGMLASFAIYAGVVVWVFAAASAARAWIGIAIPAVLLGATLHLTGHLP